jgi:hypothetical protein
LFDQNKSTDNITNHYLKLDTNSLAFGIYSEAQNFWSAAFGTGSIAYGNS